MDIKCHRCGEPWDTDTFHDVAAERGTTWEHECARFRRLGCESIPGEGRCERDPHVNGALIAALGELSGDDVDGFASDLADAEFLGIL